jgi:hypothetical protein
VGKQANYDRNKFNVTPPTLDQVPKNWIRLTSDQTIYHTWGSSSDIWSDENADNVKYVSPGGHYEAVYDRNGKLVTDPLNEGTYNYGSPLDNKWTHFKDDMVPYYLWGNSPDDPTSWYERLWRLFDHPDPSDQNPGGSDPGKKTCPLSQ